MGHIKTIELSNGNIGLEITYGGKECPFGGVDTSAPPAYIDPKCFTDCDGFLVIDGKLVAVTMAPADTPPLWSATAGVSLIGFGNFYSSKYGTLNYALGYTATAIAATVGPPATPSGVEYTFYITSWNPSSPATCWNDTLVETLYNSLTPATYASLTTALSTTSNTVPGSGGTLTITGVSDGTTFPYYMGMLETVTATGGTGYVTGSTYWVAQDTNITAQVVVSATDGVLTGATVVAGTYSVDTINDLNECVTVSINGFGYNTTDSAILTYAQLSNVELEITSPGGIAIDYTVANNGVIATVPAPVTHSSPLIAITEIVNNGVVYGIPSGGGVSPVSGAVKTINFFFGGGSGFNAGDIYYLDEYDESSYNSIPVSDGTASFLVTSVGTGGTIASGQVFTTGKDDSGYFAASYNKYTAYMLRRAPVNVLSAGDAYILNTMAANINGLGVTPYTTPDPNVSAVVNSLAGSLTLTALLSGYVGNGITVQDKSDISGPNLYYYYFPIRSATPLSGGGPGDSSTVLSTVLPLQASIVAVGGTLYIGNIGPLILKYSGPAYLGAAGLVVSTTYWGMRTLRKFAGSLIGLGVLQAPGGTPPGTFLSGTDMMFAWTTANALDVWNPLDIYNNITGAGFNQLADIGDYLAGLVVTSGTAFILRAQGLSYATATGNATNPFNWSHIGLGDQGEGAQVTALVCQYDKTGFYVGNSNVYQIANSIVAIGQKIKNFLLTTLNTGELATAAACAISVGNDTSPIVGFIVGQNVASQFVIFNYNASNDTWMLQRIPVTFGASWNHHRSLSNGLLGVLAKLNTFASTQMNNQALFTYACQQTDSYRIGVLYATTLLAPAFYSLQEGVVNSESLSPVSTLASVTFVQEEVCFGRDITIDGLYIALFADVSENVVIDFYVSGVYFNTLTLTPAQFNTLDGIPVELQLTSQIGSFTVHSPQLSYIVNSIADAGTAQIRFTKFAMFGSFDPKQRPV